MSKDKEFMYQTLKKKNRRCANEIEKSYIVHFFNFFLIKILKI